jgi:hypothetical protein
LIRSRSASLRASFVRLSFPSSDVAP